MSHFNVSNLKIENLTSFIMLFPFLISIAFSWLSSHYENSKSTSGYLCELKQTLVGFLRAFNRGKFLPGS